MRSVVYKCDVTTTNNNTEITKAYYGLTSREFKQRYYEHRQAFNKEKSPRATELSNYVWKLKNQGKEFTLNWSIKAKAPTFKSGSKRCQLCLKEKVAIALEEPGTLLNSRTELLSKCVHKKDFELRYHRYPP